MAGVGTAFSMVFAWSLASLAIGFIMLRIINAWLVDKTLEFGQALMLTVGIVAILAALWNTQNTSYMYGYIVLLLGIAGAVQLIGQARDRRFMADMRAESMARYRTVLERDPRNGAAHVFLGDALLEDGRIDEAIASYQTAVNLDPEHASRERWKQQLAERERDRRLKGRPRRCAECGMENEPHAHTCAQCYAPLVLPFVRWLLQRKTLLNLVHRAWVPTLVIGILLLTLVVVPRPIAGCLICAAVLVGAFLFLRKVGGDGGT